MNYIKKIMHGSFLQKMFLGEGYEQHEDRFDKVNLGSNIRLNALSFDPSANNDPLQFSGSSGPLLTECPPLENTAENSKKRKRANLPPGKLMDIAYRRD
ncbi:hypothetical protein KUCAC02_004647 [Chaenocephalus aceratus]|uniref:Uncharacterized protein n=1 Tax=Chaenocephalus aceratus TaxID=36190 RepID=A0ACB9X0V4_CHAAC|nr:hypothetical protein KUCAC02_004647 [Chaenocephalus aceratus]